MQDRLIGAVLGPYQIVERLGAGGMGSVYRAIHLPLRQERAVKVLAGGIANDPLFVRRFEREARLAASLRHRRIVQVYDIGEHAGLHYIAMELLRGQSLRDLIRTDAPLPPARAMRLLDQLAEALDFAHRHGVLHRDVKPSNVFVGPDDALTLVDFGIARAADGTVLTQSGLMGTPEYMDPEAITGGPSGPENDLYALGVVAYELLTGRVPFVAATTPAIMFAQVYTPPPAPRSVNPSLPQATEQVLMRQLAKKSTERFATGRAFVTALAATWTGRDQADTSQTSVAHSATVGSQTRPGLPPALDDDRPTPPRLGMLGPPAAHPRAVPTPASSPDRASSRRPILIGAVGIVLALLAIGWLLSPGDRGGPPAPPVGEGQEGRSAMGLTPSVRPADGAGAVSSTATSPATAVLAVATPPPTVPLPTPASTVDSAAMPPTPVPPPATPTAPRPTPVPPTPTLPSPTSTSRPTRTILWSDTFDRADADRCALGQANLDLGGGGAFGYVPLFPRGGTDGTNPIGANLVGGTLRNNGLDFGGVIFSTAPGGCGAGGRVENVGQNLNITVDLLVPSGPAGQITNAGPFFWSRAAARGDGIIGGSSAGYWVQLYSTGQVKVKQLNPQLFVAMSSPPAAFDAGAVHTLEIAVGGDRLQVAVDGGVVSFTQDGRVVTEVRLSPTSGTNQGAAGIAFGAEDNRGQAGGQQADNLVVSAYSPL